MPPPHTHTQEEMVAGEHLPEDLQLGAALLWPSGQTALAVWKGLLIVSHSKPAFLPTQSGPLKEWITSVCPLPGEALWSLTNQAGSSSKKRDVFHAGTALCGFPIVGATAYTAQQQQDFHATGVPASGPHQWSSSLLQTTGAVSVFLKLATENHYSHMTL